MPSADAFRRALLGLLLLGAPACDDDFLLPTGGSDGPVTGEGWCAVRTVFQNECVQCHSASSALGGLDLETDPHGAIVGVAAAADPSLTLVTPGDANASLLYLKLLPDPPVGGIMPPGNALDTALTTIVADWIADGAPEVTDCASGGDTDVTSDGVHADGFDDPTVHGAAAKQGELPCTSCHGADLTGVGEAVSCDTCHPSGWREDCTFCHGDATTGQPAPPVHLSGQDDGAAASFIPHLPHVEETAIKPALECTECHVLPTDVLSAGHLFVGDLTPGVAEVDFSTGLAAAARWNNGTCTNNYCHGNGRGDNGTVTHTEAVGACNDCHPGPTSRGDWDRMSGEHDEHLDEGIACWECHGETTDAGATITGLAVHVDGAPTVALRAGMSRDNGRCTGSCHGEGHNGRAW